MTSALTGLADPRAYVRLAAIVRLQITDGTLEPGQPAPPITRLSQEHGHARPTCGKASPHSRVCSWEVRFQPRPSTGSARSGPLG